MQKLVILRGNSGSGKSTVAKRLRKKMGYETMLIPQDVVRREMLRVRDAPDNPAVQLLYDLAMYGKKLGFDVVIEGILGKDKYGEMLERLIEDFGGDTHVFYFDISFDETLRRHSTKPNKDEYGEKELREWWAEKDYLGTPNETYIDDYMSEDEIVDFMYANIDEE